MSSPAPCTLARLTQSGRRRSEAGRLCRYIKLHSTGMRVCARCGKVTRRAPIVHSLTGAALSGKQSRDLGWSVSRLARGHTIPACPFQGWRKLGRSESRKTSAAAEALRTNLRTAREPFAPLLETVLWGGHLAVLIDAQATLEVRASPLKLGGTRSASCTRTGTCRTPSGGLCAGSPSQPSLPCPRSGSRWPRLVP